MIIIKSFLTGALYDFSNFVLGYSNKGDQVRECYSCLKLMNCWFLKDIFHKTLHIFLKTLNDSSTTLKQRNSHEVSYD